MHMQFDSPAAGFPQRVPGGHAGGAGRLTVRVLVDSQHLEPGMPHVSTSSTSGPRLPGPPLHGPRGRRQPQSFSQSPTTSQGLEHSPVADPTGAFRTSPVRRSGRGAQTRSHQTCRPGRGAVASATRSCGRARRGIRSSQRYDRAATCTLGPEVRVGQRDGEAGRCERSKRKRPLGRPRVPLRELDRASEPAFAPRASPTTTFSAARISARRLHVRDRKTPCPIGGGDELRVQMGVVRVSAEPKPCRRSLAGCPAREVLGEPASRVALARHDDEAAGLGARHCRPSALATGATSAFGVVRASVTGSSCTTRTPAARPNLSSHASHGRPCPSTPSTWLRGAGRDGDQRREIRGGARLVAARGERGPEAETVADLNAAGQSPDQPIAKTCRRDRDPALVAMGSGDRRRRSVDLAVRIAVARCPRNSGSSR